MFTAYNLLSFRFEVLAGCENILVRTSERRICTTTRQFIAAKPDHRLGAAAAAVAAARTFGLSGAFTASHDRTTSDTTKKPLCRQIQAPLAYLYFNSIDNYIFGHR